MPAPKKSLKSGNFEASIWENERDLGKDGIISYKTITLRKTWKDNKNTSREQRINLRKQDVERMLVLLRKIQEHILLEEKK